jgi:hypothetical protein
MPCHRPRRTTRRAAVADEFHFPDWLTVKEELALPAVPPVTPDPPMPPATKNRHLQSPLKAPTQSTGAFVSNKIDCPLRIKSNMGPVNRKPTQQQARIISTRRQSAQGAQFGAPPRGQYVKWCAVATENLPATRLHHEIAAFVEEYSLITAVWIDCPEAFRMPWFAGAFLQPEWPPSVIPSAEMSFRCARGLPSKVEFSRQAAGATRVTARLLRHEFLR